jgi:hypothetical protein
MKIMYLIYEVFIAMTMQITIFLHVTPCSVVHWYQRFEETSCQWVILLT